MTMLAHAYVPDFRPEFVGKSQISLLYVLLSDTMLSYLPLAKMERNLTDEYIRVCLQQHS